MSGLRACQNVCGVGVGGQGLVVEVGQSLEDLLVVEDPLDALEGRLPLAVAEVRVRGLGSRLELDQRLPPPLNRGLLVEVILAKLPRGR